MLRRDEYRLRDIKETDLEQILEWRNSERIRAVMFTDRIITIDEHRAWFESLKHRQDSIYKIFEFLGQPAGLINLTDIDLYNKKCYWGFYLGKDDLPPGIGSIMGYLGLDFAFEKNNIRKLCGRVLAFNTSSIKFFKRFGFLEEGRFLKHVFKNGRYEDVISFALFNEAWRDNKKTLEDLVFTKSKFNSG